MKKSLRAMGREETFHESLKAERHFMFWKLIEIYLLFLHFVVGGTVGNPAKVLRLEF